jgi:hypothetical protein
MVLAAKISVRRYERRGHGKQMAKIHDKARFKRPISYHADTHCRGGA